MKKKAYNLLDVSLPDGVPLLSIQRVEVLEFSKFIKKISTARSRFEL
jgi:hypothetical protein